MFAGTTQRLAVCRTLLANAGLPESLWTEEGPKRFRPSRLWSPSQILIYQIAKAVWRTPFEVKVDFSSILITLDDYQRNMIARLLLAFSEGPSGVDVWISGYTPHDNDHRRRM